MYKFSQIAGNVNTILTQVGTVQEAIKVLATPAEGMWSASEFANNYRLDKNWLSTPSFFVIDIDDGLSWTDAKNRIQMTGLSAAVLSTRSHQKAKGNKPACDRYRIVFELSAPINTREAYDATWQYVAELFPELDRACKDEARGYYYSTGVLWQDWSGQPLQPRSGTSKSTPIKLKIETLSVRGKLYRATKDFLAQEPDVLPWHTRFFKAAVNMKEQGYSKEEAAEKLKRASPVLELDKNDWKQLEDVYANRGGAMEFCIDWPVMLPATKKGPSRPSPTAIQNLRYLLTDVLQIRFKYNVRREIIYIQYPGMPVRHLANGDIATLSTKAREHGLIAGPPLVDLITATAREASFDPLLDAFGKLTWDGQPHIEKLFQTLQLPPETAPDARAWYHTMLRRWLIGVVRKAHMPGSENNVLVFQGQQAAGKSRWLMRLASIWPEGFGEGSLNPEDKDHELRHLDNFLWHVAEFDSTTSRREVGALKDYFTKNTVTVRRPFSPLPIIGQSICSFCASVNSFDFLHDATGNRRYLVIPVVAVDQLHTVDIEQVWAEAQAAHFAGERQWFNREEIAEINQLNARFMSREEYLDDITEKVKPGTDSMSIRELMVHINYGNVQITKPVRSNIRSVLDKAGIKTEVKGAATRFLVDKAKLVSQNEQSNNVKWKQ